MAHRGTSARIAAAVRDYEQAVENRKSFDSNWTEVEELVVPIRGSNIGSNIRRTPGQIITNRVFDSTAIFANEQFAAMLASNLINPSLDWFDLMFLNPNVQEDEEAARWLTMVRDRILVYMNMPESHFHEAAHEFFLDLGGYGTGAINMHAQMTGVPIIFETRPIQSVYIREDAKGMVNTVFLSMRLRPAQAIDLYGANAPDKVQKAFAAGRHNEEFDFVQIIRPRELYEPKSKGKKFQSLHVYVPEKKLLRESGFDEMPVVVARLAKLSGEQYGRGPGMNHLPDIRMLQRMQEVLIRGAQKMIDPPLLVPDEGVIGPLRTAASGLTVIRQGLKNKPEPLMTGGRVDIGLELIRGTQDQVFRGFFLNPSDFNPPKSHVTAAAILDQRDERFRRMAPMIARLQTEWLARIVNRYVSHMAKRNLLPQAPDIVRNQEFRVKFSSPVAQAQLLTKSENMVRFLQRILPVLEMDPDARLDLDPSAYIRMQREATSAPIELLRDPADVAADKEGLKQARAEQAGAENRALQAQAAERFARSLEGANER